MFFGIPEAFFPGWSRLRSTIGSTFGGRAETTKTHGGAKVMIDADLAVLYGVPTKALKQQIRRSIERFPEDFMFELTKYEKDELVTNCDRLVLLKHSSVNPMPFTEQGVSMLSSVLRS